MALHHSPPGPDICDVKHRVVHLVGSLEVNGATKQLAHLATQLPSAEFESHVIVLRADPAALEMLRNKSVEPAVIGWRGPWDVVGFWRLSQQLRRRKADIVHVWPAGFGSWPMEVCARLAGIRRRVVSIRSLENQEKHSALGSVQRIAKGADHVVVNSASVRNGCIASGISAEKVTVIFDGVCPIEKNSASRQQLLSELQLPSDAKLVAFLGAVNEAETVEGTDLGDGSIKSCRNQGSPVNHWRWSATKAIGAVQLAQPS